MVKVRIVTVAKYEQVIERPFKELALSFKDTGLISSYLFILLAKEFRTLLEV